MKGRFKQLVASAKRDASLAIDQWPARRRRFLGWIFKAAEFAAVQGFVQLFLAAAGLIIVRTLPKSEYALFAIANSMQVACTQLADLGIGPGVRSIGGRVWNDRFRLGQLLNTALGLRRRFFVLSLSVCVPVTAWLLWRNNAGITRNVGLCLALVVGVIPLLGVSVWSVIVLLGGQYRRVQKLDLGNSTLRLGLLGGLSLVRMNALVAVLVGVAGNWVEGVFLRNWVREKVVPAAPVNPDYRRELIRLSITRLPNTIFYCFQGQVVLFILTLLGSPTGIADVTALGRIAALFAIFSVMFQNLLTPPFARCQDQPRLRQLYLELLSGAGLVLLPLSAAAWVFPGPFLWLLGSKYAGLERECGWIMTAGCLSQFAAVMWSLNMTRAWIHVQSYGFIPAVLAAQAIVASSIDLHRFHNVVIFYFVTAAVPIPLYMLDAYFGLRRRLSHP
jgi:hypothetical protein